MSEETGETFDERVLNALNNPPAYAPFPSFAEFASAPFDSTTLDVFAGMLADTRREVKPERLQAAVERATKWAAVDTGAIEGLYEVERGFTFSVAAGAAAWDNMHAHVGEADKRAINDALEAYEYVLDVATQARPVTETWIKELHEVICRSQQTYTVITAAGRQEHALPKGEYKKHPNNPLNYDSGSVHAYAPVEMTGPEMHRLVDELETAAFKEAHPVLQAAYSHYAYVCIHPFADGNGRVARALASIFLYRSPGVPLVIFADQKPSYLDALEVADRGNYSLFSQFIGERAVDVVRMVTDDLRRPPRPALSDALAQLQSSLLGRGGLVHEEVDALCGRLLDETATALNKVLSENPLSPPLAVQVNVLQGGFDPKNGNYRAIPNSRYIQVAVSVKGPGASQSIAQIGSFVAKADLDVADFVVLVQGRDELPLEALVRDLEPTVSPALTYRLETLAENLFRALVEHAIQQSQVALRNSGYR